MPSLARDQHGSVFEPPSEAAWWRVRRQTGGRPSPIVGADGAQAFVELDCDLADLRALGCKGMIRLEAVDSNYKPLDAPVAFVELGDDAPQRPLPANDNSDLVRSSVESLTRTMEAMQRAQVERERALAQKERALTDAQVAAQRMHTDLMIALLERAGGGKPQDPITVLKQQLAFQRTLENETGKNRDATPLPLPAASADDEQPGWLNKVAPFAPVVATTLQEVVVNQFAKDDPIKADKLRSSMANYAGFAAQLIGGAAPTAPAQVVAQKISEADDESDDRPPLPKSARELLAQLDDAEAAAFDRVLDKLSDAEYAQLGPAIESQGGIEERLAWARSIINGQAPRNAPAETTAPGAAQATIDQTAPPSVSGLGDLPPELVPILTQLSREEQAAGLSIIAVLDRGTIQKLVERLLSMPPARALKTIRSAITDAQRRSPAVAHRAVAAALREDEESHAPKDSAGANSHASRSKAGDS